MNILYIFKNHKRMNRFVKNRIQPGSIALNTKEQQEPEKEPEPDKELGLF